MSYITYDYYMTTFGGRQIPEEDFDYLAEAATTVVDLLVTSPIISVTETVRRAVAYQAEVLFTQGGSDAIGGLAAVTSGIDERLGDYSIGTPYVSNEKRCYSIGGVPVSGLTLMLLKKAGLITRCVYEEGDL
ncbi:MAG: hypothetical protein E7618_02770 [Ruminococcaceae bacterium]|nr:hypothetical protein [Oscillospiraceae bacterium]